MAIDRLNNRLPTVAADSSALRPKNLQSQASSTSKSTGAETVTLTEQSQKLNESLFSQASQPPINRDKIDAIKQALADGTYVIDNAKIAEKLQTFERLLES